MLLIVVAVVMVGVALVAVLLLSEGDDPGAPSSPDRRGAGEETAASRPARDRSGAYDGQVLESCGLAVLEAGDSDEDAAVARRDDYDPRWSAYASQEDFVEAVVACATVVGEAQAAEECGGVAPIETLVDDADRLEGRCFPLVVSVTQATSGRAPCTVRARADTVPKQSSAQYAVGNALVRFDDPCPALDTVSADDVLLLQVRIDGSEQYETVFGATATAVGLAAVEGFELLHDG